MKRHKSLYPLSHDHHHALVQARNLRVASSDPGLPSFLKAGRDFIAFWDSKLQTHFRQEEEILLPGFSKYSSTDRVEIIETLKQHIEIRRACRELRDNLNKEAAPEAESLRKLGALLEKHIRYEENQLFPAIEEAVPEEELWEMNRLMAEDQITGTKID